MPRGVIARLKVVALALLIAASAPAAPAENPNAIRKLRFSTDGRYILAQDASGITVLTVSPLAALFRIPAEDVTDAQFTPDSRHITFLRGGTQVDAAEIKLAKSPARVESWSIADQTRMEQHELPNHACAAQQLSPDGHTFACEDVLGALWLIDADSGNTILREDSFAHAFRWNGPRIGASTTSLAMGLTLPGSVEIAFSPNARYLIIAAQGHTRSEAPLALDPKEYWSSNATAWDVHMGQHVALKGQLNVLAENAVTHPSDADKRRYFAFLAPDRLLVSDLMYAKNGNVTAELLEFPSGRLLAKPVLPAGKLFPATDPGFVIVRPAGQERTDHPLRTVDVELDTQERIVSETPALDVLGRYYVAEPRAGCVGLCERGKGLEATIDLHKR